MWPIIRISLILHRLDFYVINVGRIVAIVIRVVKNSCWTLNALMHVLAVKLVHLSGMR